MMVPGPDNQSTCEGEICLNIGRSSPGVSGGQCGGQCGARVRVVSNVNHNKWRRVLFDPTQHQAGHCIVSQILHKTQRSGLIV